MMPFGIGENAAFDMTGFARYCQSVNLWSWNAAIEEKIRRRWRYLAVIAAATPSATILAVCLLIPFMALCAGVGYVWTLNEQAKSTDRIVMQTDAVADDIARFLEGRIVVLKALATSPAIDSGDISAFESQARELFAKEGIGAILQDSSGKVLFDTMAMRDVDRVRSAVVSHDTPHVSDLIDRGSDKSPLVYLDMPVVPDGVLRFVLTAVLHPVAFDDLLRRGGIGGDLMGVVLDRNGRVVGRSATSELKTGEILRSYHLRPGRSGVWTGLGQSGTMVKVAYRRLPESEWMVSVGMTEAAFRSPLQRWIWGISTLVVVSILGAMALILPAMRRVCATRSELVEAAELLRLAQDAAGAGVWEVDLDKQVLRLSPDAARLLECQDNPGVPVVLPIEDWRALICEDDREELEIQFARVLAEGADYSAEFRVGGRPGATTLRWMQIYGRFVLDERNHQAVRMVGQIIDITPRKQAEEALRISEARLRISEERLALAFDVGEDGLFDWNMASGTIWLSERWRTKLGLSGSLAQPSSPAWIKAIYPEDRERVSRVTRDHLKGRTPVLECDYRLHGGDGQIIWVMARARVAAWSADGRALRLVGTLIDITARKEAECRITHMALHDALTGLPNRNLFRRYLDDGLAKAELAPDSQAMLALDLDRFKAVNDTFGHVAGDKLLCLAAERIRMAVRQQDVVARLGGDEFAVMLDTVASEAEVSCIGQRIIESLEEPLLLHGNRVSIGVSIGAVLLSNDRADAAEIFKRADAALYSAKDAGRNTLRMFDAEVHTRTTMRSLLAIDMKDAIRRGDFFLVYQPIIDLMTGEVASFEALMRWRHPERGLISPADFIPVAEETGLIDTLGAWALNEGCQEALSWPNGVRVSVNVSAAQFRGDLDHAVLSALVRTGLPAGRLKLEVTESLLVVDAEAALATLQRLKKLGVKIALDDFGTGYSSLSYLRRFPFDKIKIDRAFIKDIADPEAAAIVRAIVGIGERLGMGIVAEGVETSEQLEMVRREGCMEVQGYVFSKPLPAEDARTFIKIRNTAP